MAMLMKDGLTELEVKKIESSIRQGTVLCLDNYVRREFVPDVFV